MATPKTHKNPRRKTLADLKTIKDRVQSAISGWTVRSTVTEYHRETQTIRRNPWAPVSDDNPLVETEIHKATDRPRQPHEYPENSPQAWAQLYHEAQALADLAIQLREFANQQYHESVDRRNAA